MTQSSPVSTLLDYAQIISVASKEMLAALEGRQAGERVYLWLFPTNADADGHIFIGSDAPIDPHGRLPRCILPHENQASPHQRWEDVPVDQITNVMIDACIREPILAIER